MARRTIIRIKFPLMIIDNKFIAKELAGELFKLKKDISVKFIIFTYMMEYKGVPIESISIFSTPMIYLQLLLITIQHLFASLLAFIQRRALIIATTVFISVLITYLPMLQVPSFPPRSLKILPGLLHTGFFWESHHQLALELVCIHLFCTSGLTLQR